MNLPEAINTARANPAHMPQVIGHTKINFGERAEFIEKQRIDLNLFGKGIVLGNQPEMQVTAKAKVAFQPADAAAVKRPGIIQWR